MIFSILIPTLEERQPLFHSLYTELNRQITENHLEKVVEIISFSDNRESTIGFKRNWLLGKAQGEFVTFIDDDDAVCDDYIPVIVRAVREHPDIDCIGIKGQITFNGTHPRIFVHSLQYREYFSRQGVYYRPPYHLNPIRREIGTQYPFAEINYSEDIDWAMRICRDLVLQKEYFIDRVLYYYYSRRSWRYQQLLDLTEPLRHALGLQFANRLRIQRWWKPLV